MECGFDLSFVIYLVMSPRKHCQATATGDLRAAWWDESRQVVFLEHLFFVPCNLWFVKALSSNATNTRNDMII